MAGGHDRNVSRTQHNHGGIRQHPRAHGTILHRSPKSSDRRIQSTLVQLFCSGIRPGDLRYYLVVGKHKHSIAVWIVAHGVVAAVQHGNLAI